MENIIIKGACEHNLKNIDVTLPRNKFIVITGLSGSGKSSLAFDTIYAEGQRRYVESLSSYARQFLGLMQKPQVDRIEGLSPAISIEQKTTSHNPRSTVGTVTEIYDYLRLLFARIGIPHCPTHGIKIETQSPQSIGQQMFAEFQNTTITILAPIVRQKKGTYEKLIEDLHTDGYTRVRINKEIVRTDEKINLERYKKHDIEIVIDRIAVTAEEKTRLLEAVEHALGKGDGLVIALAEDKKENLYSAKLACPKCGMTMEELQPRMFSFNSPFGACEKCHGLGILQEFDSELVLDKSKSIMEGAIRPAGNNISGMRMQQLAQVCKEYSIPLTVPLKTLSKKQLDIILYGTDQRMQFVLQSKSGTSDFRFVGSYEGVIPNLHRLYHETESEWRRSDMERYMVIKPCPACKGARLKEKMLHVFVSGKSIVEVTNLSIEQCILFFETLTLSVQQQQIAHQVLKEIRQRLTFLKDVGLSYLTLSRNAGSLSGGEAQRIRLATQIGSNLTGVLYVLDEPSIGLHQRDNHKLIETLHKLRDLGNTLIVVEHDEDTILKADWVVDMGPAAGIHGGHVIAQGTPQQIMKQPKSLTGQYLCRKLTIEIPKKRRMPASFLTIQGARENNLKNIEVKIPLGVFVSVTGVSGSGKSTLIYEILYKAMMKKLHDSKAQPGLHDTILFGKEIDKVINIDQSPIGRTPRSNPATYTGLFGDIRDIFFHTPDAKIRGYKPGRFSFNVKGGRCEKCEGDGVLKIEMNFLPDVFVECEECKGRRYNAETLEIRYKGKNISDVLNMSIEEALAFFENIPSLKRKLETLHDVGLDYMKLGQSSTTLSGGEAQRIKLSRELTKRDTGNTLYLLDEPTTGLHMHDVKKLLSVLNRLVDKKNTLVVIEHNLDVIKTADYIIDLGPEGGDNGGRVIAAGTPEEVAENVKSYTGEYLRKVLGICTEH